MRHQNIYGAVIVMLLIMAVLVIGFVWIKKDKDDN